MTRLAARLVVLAVALPAPAFAQATRPAAPTTQPATTQPAAAAAVAQPAAVLRNRAVMVLSARDQRESMRQRVKDTPDGGTYKLDDLVRFSVVDGRLTSEWVGRLPTGQARRVKIEGMEAVWVVNRFNNGANAFFSLSRYDFDAPDDAFWMTTFSFQQGANVTSVYAQGGDASEVRLLSYVQQPNSVSLNLSGVDNRVRTPILTASAADLFRLRDEHPDEVRRHLAPLLRKITSQPVLQPGPGDVYRAFAAIPADPAVVRRLDELLPALSSPNPDERERATKAVRDLGPAGVLAALRYDPDLLAPEQANRLNDLIALHTRLMLPDPAEAAKDLSFLIDCFEDDDLAVRVAAKEAVERLLGEKVGFDPKSAAPVRAAAGDALRRKLSKDAAAKNPPAAPATLIAPNATLRIRG